MANVTNEQEAGEKLHVATLEVAEELERALKDQGRLQDDLDCSSDALAAATKEFSDCWAAHEATGGKLCNAFREVCNRRAAHEEICVDAEEGAATNIRNKAQGHGDTGRCGGPQGANKTHHERARQGRRPRQ